MDYQQIKFSLRDVSLFPSPAAAASNDHWDSGPQGIVQLAIRIPPNNRMAYEARNNASAIAYKQNNFSADHCEESAQLFLFPKETAHPPELSFTYYSITNVSLVDKLKVNTNIYSWDSGFWNFGFFGGSGYKGEAEDAVYFDRIDDEADDYQNECALKGGHYKKEEESCYIHLVRLN